MTRGVPLFFIALRKSVSQLQHLAARSAENLLFGHAYPRPDTGTSNGPSPLYTFRHSARIRSPPERTDSSVFQILARTAAPSAEEAVKKLVSKFTGKRHS